MEDIAHLLGAVIGNFDTDMRLICHEGLTESFLLTLREPITRGAQEKPDLVEGITLAPAVTGHVLLDATTYLTWSVTGQLDDVKGAAHAGCVLELVINGLLAVRKGSIVAIRTPAQKSYPRSASQFSCTMPDLPGTRFTQAGRGMILPACQVHDAGEFTRAPAASVLVAPHMLINPQHPHPCETGGVIKCGLQTRLDMGPHDIPRRCELSSQSCNGGSLEAQLSDCPNTQTRPGSTHRVVPLRESPDLAGVFAAYPASLKPPDPRRDPGPGRVNHLHHHTPVTLSDHPPQPGQPAK